jgi:multiple sugar transport system permease protein
MAAGSVPVSAPSDAERKLDSRFGTQASTAASIPAPVRRGLLDGLDERKLGMVLVAPSLALMAIVAAYPVAQAIWLSLFRYNIKVPDDRAFVGLGNYAQILSAPHWWDATFTTLVFTVVSVGIEFSLGLVMALAMNRAIKGLQGPIRVAVLIPWATITVVTALSWKWIFTPGMGPVNVIMAPLGGADMCMLCSRWGAMTAMIFADVWKTAPFIALLLLAGLQTISKDMYEAADVDGASKWDKFISITLPSLKPAILVALLFRTLDAVRMFDLAYLMTGGANKTDTISVLAYTDLIRNLNMGRGSAMSVLVFLGVLAIAFVYTRVLGASPSEGK